MFCATCLAESGDDSAGNISTVNGTGFQFLGDDRRCPTCGSSVRTLWRTVVNFPVTPIGTFRYKPIKTGTFEAEKFLSRRMPLDPGQVRRTRRTQTLIMAPVAVIVLVLIYLSR